MRFRLNRWCLAVLVSGVVWRACAATTWHVAPEGNDSNDGLSWGQAFATISKAVSVAAAGDEIIVSNGVYTVSTQVEIAVAIVLRSLQGASNTFVVGGYPASSNRLFVVTDAGAVLDGFTVTNGYLLNEDGAGVFMTDGTVRNCIFSGCVVTNTGPDADGGAIYISGGIVSNCLFYNNRALGTYSGYGQGGGGGALYLATNGFVVGSLFESNVAHAGGGAFMAGGGVISNCTFCGNIATIGGYEPPGGGVRKNGGTLVGCSLIGNAAVGQNANGGGVCSSSAGIILNCIIMSNSAVIGGGVYFPAGGTIRNCLVARNAASWRGGGVAHQWGCTIQNCTIADNSASSSGGGVNYGQSNWIMRLENSIVYFNTAPVGPNWDPNSPVGCYYTNINSCTSPDLPGPGALSDDPGFANRAENNYMLGSLSPCINAGTNQAWMSGFPDLAGRERVLEGTVDMGAYEFYRSTLQCAFTADCPVGFLPHTVIFNAQVNGSNLVGLVYHWDYNGDGSFDEQGPFRGVVTNVYSSCGSYTVGLMVTNAAGEVAACTNYGYVRVGPAVAYVAPSGAHVLPYTNWAIAATNIQSAIDAGVDGTLVLVTDGLYSVTSQLVVTNGITVRSVNGPGMTAIARGGGASCRIAYLSHPMAVLDGLTISDGIEFNGGGVYIQKRADFTNAFGGTLQNCAIVNNIATRSGGGVYIDYGGLLSNCVIANNTVNNQWGGGGGVWCSWGGNVDRCWVVSNRVTAAQASGGGLYLNWGGYVRNCVIAANQNAVGPNWGYGGGGVGVGGAGTIENCTICGNWGWTGGGVSGPATIYNSIAYFNTASNTASGGTNINGAAAFYSCSPDLVAGVNGNISADPLFMNRGMGYGILLSNADYRLKAWSPCVNSATSLPWMATGIDLAGLARIMSGRPDMGAFEKPSAGTVFAIR